MEYRTGRVSGILYAIDKTTTHKMTMKKMTTMPQKNNRVETEHTVYPAAPLWRRIAALFYDTLLVSAIVLVTTGLYHGIINNWLLGYREAPVGFNPWLSSLIMVIVFFFFAHCWGRNGQTLGMQAWRLRIQSTATQSTKSARSTKIKNGSVQQITLVQSLLRFMIAIPALALGGLGLLWMVIDKKKRSWHDHYSHTEIVLLPKQHR